MKPVARTAELPAVFGGYPALLHGTVYDGESQDPSLFPFFEKCHLIPGGAVHEHPAKAQIHRVDGFL